MCLFTLFYKASWKQSCLAVPRESSFKPAILAFLVHIHNVTTLKVQFMICLGRVWHDAAVPTTRMTQSALFSKHSNQRQCPCFAQITISPPWPEMGTKTESTVLVKHESGMDKLPSQQQQIGTNTWVFVQATHNGIFHYVQEVAEKV